MAPVPPVALNTMLPDCPEHLGLVAVVVSTIAVGMAIVTCLVAVHPLVSVTRIVYTPEVVAAKGELVATLFTLYVKDPVPPEALNTILPFCPAQLGFVAVADKIRGEGIAIVTDFVTLQPFASVATTE